MILLLSLTTIFYGQITGVGIKNPPGSTALQVTSANNKGVLIPRVALQAANNKSPLTGNIPNGTLVLNTANAGSGLNAVSPDLYAWFDGKWITPANINKAQDVAVQFHNVQGNTTNINPSNLNTKIAIPIFGTQAFNDDTSVFERINATSLRIKKSGVYLLSANLALRQNPAVHNSRLSAYISFEIGGQLASSKLVTLAPQYNPSNVNINGRFGFILSAYADVTAGQVLTLVSERYKSGSNYDGTVYFDSTSLSSVTIVKID